MEVRPEPKMEVRPEPKMEVRPEPKMEVRPEPKMEVRPEPKVEVRPLVDYPEVRRPVVPVPRPAPAGSAVTPAQKLPSPAPKKVIGVDDILEGSLDF